MTYRPVPQTPPRAWSPAELERDPSWVHRLSPEAVAGFDAALQHAKAVGQPWLSLSADDFPLNAAAQDALQHAFAGTQTGFGMTLMKGFPVQRLSAEDARLLHWGIGLHVGVARTQNQASQVMNDVRDEGGNYKVKNGRGYNTNAGLDFHVDSCDVVALMCLQTAKTGGTSMVTSSMAVVDELRRTRPDLVEVLRQRFFYSLQGAGDPAQLPYYSCPILSSEGLPFAFRTNRKNITAAQRDFDEVPRLSAAQTEVLDLLDTLLPDPRFCYSMTLERGDVQLLNNYTVIHSRTNFEDFEEPERKRHLLRLWLALPGSQELSPDWLDYFGDTRPGSMRGGVRGSRITPEFLAYEARQCSAHGMHYRRPG